MTQTGPHIAPVPSRDARAVHPWSSLGFARLLKPAPVDGGLELVGLVSCVSTQQQQQSATG